MLKSYLNLSKLNEKFCLSVRILMLNVTCCEFSSSKQMLLISSRSVSSSPKLFSISIGEKFFIVFSSILSGQYFIPTWILCKYDQLKIYIELVNVERHFQYNFLFITCLIVCILQVGFGGSYRIIWRCVFLLILLIWTPIEHLETNIWSKKSCCNYEI